MSKSEIKNKKESHGGEEILPPKSVRMSFNTMCVSTKVRKTFSDQGREDTEYMYSPKFSRCIKILSELNMHL